MSDATADYLDSIAVSRKVFFMHKQILRGEWTHVPADGLGFELGKDPQFPDSGRSASKWQNGRMALHQMSILLHQPAGMKEAERLLSAEGSVR